jgi:hypothetical protein
LVGGPSHLLPAPRSFFRGPLPLAGAALHPPLIGVGLGLVALPLAGGHVAFRDPLFVTHVPHVISALFHS